MADFNLPNEIWCKIFTYLPLEPKKNATATCKLWFSLIRQDPKLSGHILISWHNMETALETLHWNWSNWPALKTLELTKLEFVAESRESIQNVIEKLSLKDNCPASLEKVLFDVDLAGDLLHMQTNGQSPLKYKTYTDQIFGLGQELDSIQKWNEYESNMKALKCLKAMRHPPSGTHWAQGMTEAEHKLPIPKFFDNWPWAHWAHQLGSSNELLLLLATQDFQTFRRLCDEYG